VKWGLTRSGTWHVVERYTFVGVRTTRCGRVVPYKDVTAFYDAPFGEHPVCKVCRMNALTDLLKGDYSDASL
jgi:hypothetical protein